MPAAIHTSDAKAVKEALAGYERTVGRARLKLEEEIALAWSRYEEVERAERERLLRVARKSIPDLSDAMGPPPAEPTSVAITVLDSVRRWPVPGAMVSLVTEKGLNLSAVTDDRGIAALRIHPEVKSAHLVVSCEGFRAEFRKVVDVASGQQVVVSRFGTGGSLTFPDESGAVPGLEGDLQFHQDGTKYYVYATNVAINGGGEQPVDYRLQDWISFEDVHGRRFRVRVVGHAGRTVALEYERLK